MREKIWFDSLEKKNLWCEEKLKKESLVNEILYVRKKNNKKKS